MICYSKPTLRCKPNVIIYHAGTNDLHLKICNSDNIFLSHVSKGLDKYLCYYDNMFLSHVSKGLDKYLCYYDNIFLSHVSKGRDKYLCYYDNMFLSHVSKGLDKYLCYYDNIFLSHVSKGLDKYLCYYDNMFLSHVSKGVDKYLCYYDNMFLSHVSKGLDKYPCYYDNMFLSHVSKGLDKYLCYYDNILILRDVNASMSNETLKDFCEMYSFKNLITEPTCYKNPNNPSSIDVILTNQVNNFYNSTVIETGLSDHHTMTLTGVKACIPKKKPVTVIFRSYKKFVEESFKNDLINNLQNFVKTMMSYDKYNEIFECFTHSCHLKKEDYTR